MCQFACRCPRFFLGLPWKKGALAATRVFVFVCVFVWEFLSFVFYLPYLVCTCLSAFSILGLCLLASLSVSLMIFLIP